MHLKNYQKVPLFVDNPNCYRSAISSTHIPIEGVPVGQHPLVINQLKGAFNLRLPKPRYSHTWDYQMLSFLTEFGESKELSLMKLTQKFIMLWELVIGQRCSDLVRLNLTGWFYSGGKANVTCEGLAKQTRPNNEQSLHPVKIKAFEDKQLCSVSCIKAYKRATTSIRVREGEDKLLLAAIPPHNPLSSSSISRWIKKSLIEDKLKVTLLTL